MCAGCRCSNAQSSTICEAYSCLTPIEGQPGEFTSVEDCYNWTECPAGKVCILDWDRHEDEPLPGWDTYVYWCVCQ